MSKPISQQKSMERAAQYGGVGGGHSPFAPGGSPLGRGFGIGGGWDINRYIADRSFDAILEQSHNPAPIDPDRNLEKRLEDQHTYAEEDSIPYDLTPAERERLKIRKEIRRREKFYEEAARSIRENSPAFIQQHFPPKKEHVTPLDAQLQSHRKTDDGAHTKDSREDEVPLQIKPSRFHPVLSQSHPERTAHLISRPNEINDEDSEERHWANKARMTYPLGLGSTPLLELGLELDQYLEDSAKQNWGGQKSMANEPSVAFDIQEPDEFSLLRKPESHSLPSSVGEMAKDVVNGMGRLDHSEYDLMSVADDPFLPLEAKLEATNRIEPERAPHDRFPSNRWELHQNEPKGITDKYQQRFEGQGSPWRL
jgi:hypothetical protein